MKRILTLLLCAVTLMSTTGILSAAAEVISDVEVAVAKTDGSADDSADIVLTSKQDIAEVSAQADLSETGYSIPSETSFVNTLSSLRSKYPNGQAWAGVYYESGSAKAWTCFAYAVQMMYEVFGARYYSDRIYDYTSYSFGTIYAGDIVRIDGDSHSIFITKVTDDGYYFTDGNSVGYNVVQWDGFYSTSELKSRFTYKVHLPGNTLTGQGEALTHTIAYSSNGGSGSMSSDKITPSSSFTLSYNEFTKSGYTFAGYIVRRSYDNKWYTADAGWQSTADIYDNDYTYKVYPQGATYTLGTPWIGGISTSTTFTFYAQWVSNISTVEYFDNYSGYNYILGSDLDSDYSNYIYSRDSSVYTVSVDNSEKLNNASSLKIVGSTAGKSGADLAVRTSTNYGIGDGYSQLEGVGDNKNMTLHFYAKASVNGAKMYIRWGYSSDYTSVTLTNSWKVYSVSVPKNEFYGNSLHPYFDTAGTYYINSLALGDGSWTTNVVPESGGKAYTETVANGEEIGSLPEPTREGYTFEGWYTATEGGTLVTSDTEITESHLRLYAHWSKDITVEPSLVYESDGHIYALYDNVMSWEDASTFCMLMGGHLVSITSESENQLVYDMISGRQGYCWTALCYDDDEEEWGWASDDDLDYRNWYSSSYETTDTGEYYGMIYPMNVGATAYAAKWDKVAGSSYYRSYYGYYNSFFICEYDYPEYLGDIDGDGEVTVADVVLIQRYQAGIETDYDFFVPLYGDADGSGEIEIVDATYIQRWLAKHETPYPIGEWMR